MTPYFDRDGVTLYHGDCLDILPALSGIDAVVTDPPYGLGDKWRGGLKKWPLAQNGRATTWDREIAAGLPGWIADLGKPSIVWGGQYYALPPSRGWLIWDKIVRKFTSGHCEMAWTNIDQPIRAFNYARGTLAGEGKVHPTQKPAPLMRWCIGHLKLPECSAILDPYMGSGTTGVAAVQLNHRFIGIELDERYCEIAAKRIEAEMAKTVLFA